MDRVEGGNAPASLDDLVTSVATTLMGVDTRSLVPTTGRVLRGLVEYFQVDLSFLRFHDAGRRATVLVSEWPPRDVVPEPDPLGVIPFAGADPVFAASEDLREVLVVRPGDSDGYQERVQNGSGVAATSLAVVPLRAGATTTGALGFVKFGDRGWGDDELRALKTIALLLAQLQARLEAEDQLRHLAHHDELTGLPNRRALLARLQAALEDPARHAPGGPRPALLFVDVDRLKALNDFLGHEAGDRFIVAVAERMRGAVGPDDILARLGGDEFVVAVPGTGGEARAAAVAGRIQRAMVDPIRLGGQSLSRTVSIGIAVADPGVTTVAEWLRNADQSVLAAKERGGNTVVGFTAEMAAREQVRVAVEMNLLSAIRAGLLMVHFQPVIDLRTRTTIGVEALLRWDHPTLGPLAPELFVGVAEATNLAGELGRWVLGEACRQFACWRRALPADVAAGITVAVNVSPVQLIADDFVDTVARVLDVNGLAARDLVLEITEHAVVRDTATTLTTLEGLRRLGVSVAIDDFGTGYSSLAQLKSLPVSALKIDRSFVRDLGTNPEDLAIVRSIVGLADSFGLDVIAEGVESELAAQTLLGLGCTAVQGYLFSRAVPAETIVTRLGGVLAPGPPGPS